MSVVVRLAVTGRYMDSANGDHPSLADTRPLRRTRASTGPNQTVAAARTAITRTDIYERTVLTDVPPAETSDSLQRWPKFIIYEEEIYEHGKIQIMHYLDDTKYGH